MHSLCKMLVQALHMVLMQGTCQQRLCPQHVLVLYSSSEVLWHIYAVGGIPVEQLVCTLSPAYPFGGADAQGHI